MKKGVGNFSGIKVYDATLIHPTLAYSKLISFEKTSPFLFEVKSTGADTAAGAIGAIGSQPVVVLKFPVGLHCMKFVEFNVAGIAAEPSNFTAQIGFGVIATLVNMCHVFAMPHKVELPASVNESVDIAVLVIAEFNTTNRAPFAPEL